MKLGKRFMAKTRIKLTGDIILYLTDDVDELKKQIYSNSPNIKVNLAMFNSKTMVMSKKDIIYYEKITK